MDAYWLEQTKTDVPAGDHWLSGEELSRLADLRFEKRRADWRLGRWIAKRAVASCLKFPADVDALVDIEIRAAPSGAPRVFLFNLPADVSLSLSHRTCSALCVVALSGPSLGCDLELVESRDPSFVTDFFTENEQRLVDRTPLDDKPMLTTLLWSAKESALKALHVGLRQDTTSVEVSLADEGLHLADDWHQHSCSSWSRLSVRCTGDRILRGWWRCASNMVRTVVFNPLQ